MMVIPARLALDYALTFRSSFACCNILTRHPTFPSLETRSLLSPYACGGQCRFWQQCHAKMQVPNYDIHE